MKVVRRHIGDDGIFLANCSDGHSALRHEWTDRLRAVCEKMGLTPTAATVARERRLEAEAGAMTTTPLMAMS